MTKVRIVHGILGLVLLFAGVVGLLADRAVLATEEGSSGSFLSPPSQEQPLVDKLELKTQYPVLRGKSAESFEFEVELNYQGSSERRFEFSLNAPSQWVARTLQSYGDKEIGAITLEPGAQYAEKIKVSLAPLGFYYPEEGEYVVTLEVGSGEVKDSIELKAVVTARYEFKMTTTTGRLSTEADAGKDNSLSIKLFNLGSADIENITFSSSNPDGWDITFDPDKVDSIPSIDEKEVKVIIKPPRKTIAGDYMITLRANSKEVSDKLELRVTVLTPSIWGWVGILIVLLVIAGLGVIFWRLGRR